MCNRAAQQATAEALARDLGADFFRVGRRPLSLPRVRIDPKDLLPVVAYEDGAPVAMDAIWGMPFAGATWNARDDRLRESPAWGRLLGAPGHHAVAVLSHVFEAFTARTLQAVGAEASLPVVGRDAVATARAGGTAWHGIRRRDGRPILVPCLTTQAQGKRWATMVTTRANDVWGTLHRPETDPHETRQVVWLQGVREARTWLAAKGGAQDLLRPCRPEDMVFHRVAPDGWRTGDPFTPWQAGQAGLDAFGAA